MKSLINPKPGDFFYIPAWNIDKEHGFVIARHIELVEPNIGYLMEVFDTFYQKCPNKIEDIDTSKRLFRPILWSMYFFKPYPRWKIILSDPSYQKSQSDYEGITISFPDGLWVGGKSVNATSTALQDNHEPSICWSVNNIIIRVVAHLESLFKPDEVFDYNKLPNRLRADDPERDTLVENLVIEMDQKFKSWQKNKS